MCPRLLYPLLLPFVMCLAGCETTAGTATDPWKLPPPVEGLKFGQPLEAFRSANPRAEKTDSGPYDFRQVWIVRNPGAGLDSVVYYFDAEGNQPLYEVILNYSDIEDRDRWIAENLGEPNHPNGKEWVFPTASGYDLNIWTFQNKLIYAASIPGTEWDEDGDGKMDG